MKAIKKAVFPVAGLGTRFLPITKASPKEMLPIIDKPLIQYAVEEAIEFGCTEMIFITNHCKDSIKKHFSIDKHLEKIVSHNPNLLFTLQRIIPSNITYDFVFQPEPLGLGDAVLRAKDVVGDEPFALLLPDDLFNGSPNCLQQMLPIFLKTKRSSVLTIEEVATSEIHKFGIVGLKNEDGQLQVSTIVEKPTPESAPSNWAVGGRYLLSPSIFTYLENISAGAGGEIQLTDGINLLLKNEPVYANTFLGTRFDCGSKLGYLKANVEFGLRHNEIGKYFEEYLYDLCNIPPANRPIQFLKDPS